MALPFYNWSLTAASNATADSTVNWAEGMAPSAVNDSARAMMASTAAFRDDISGSIATGGTSTAYTVTTNQVFDSLAHLNGKVVAFTPHTTNGASPTLNVDGLGAKSIRAKSGVDLQSGVLIQGTPYVVLYNSSDAVFYLFGVGPDPGMPLGSSIDYWGSSAPTTHFALAYGQAVSRTTYATLFSLLSTTYGSGDGSTTFNLPDLRGRVTAGKDDMGGSSASRLTSSYFGTSAAALGAVGGDEKVALTAANIPAGVQSSASNNITVDFGGYLSMTNNSQATVPVASTGSLYTVYAPSGNADWLLNRTASSATANNIYVTSTNAGQTNPRTVQPTIVANKLIRII